VSIYKIGVIKATSKTTQEKQITQPVHYQKFLDKSFFEFFIPPGPR